MNTLRQPRQGPTLRNEGEYEYLHLQNLIFDKTRVVCHVKVHKDLVNIRTKDYADFLIARSVIKDRVSKEIYRDFQALEVVK